MVASRGAAIKFGTDGWRGHIADDFTFDNVALVGSAIRHYLEETGVAEQPLLVGYDRRFAAELLAAHLAGHLRELGQQVRVFDSACPTPAVAFAVEHLKAAGAVMLTASHNPYHYQGLKFIPYFAGPAMPETTDRITDLIREIGVSFVPPSLRLSWDGDSLDIREEYYAALDRLVDRDVLRQGNLRVLYTAMHGCGAGWLDGYLQRAGVEVDTIAAERDVYFGGSLPDPSPANLTPLAERGDYPIIIGTDGDADRFGIVDREGRYFGANQVLPMLADYLIQAKGLSGALVRTVATSHTIDGIAKIYGLPLIETPVGFKYVGDELRRGALIGGEESGGISIQGHVPEKDGILAVLLILEMLADTRNNLWTLYEETLQRVGPHYYRRIDMVVTDSGKQRLWAALSAAGDAFAGHEIADRNTVDGIKLLFADGCWMLVRASGTEPVIRLYMEATSENELTAMAESIQREIARITGESVQHAGH